MSSPGPVFRFLSFMLPVFALGACTAPGVIAPVQTTASSGQLGTSQPSTVQTATYVAPQPVQQTVPGRPAALVLDTGVTSANDETLSDSQLNRLISGRTIYSQNLDDPSKTQVGTFTQDGNMSVATGGNTITGRWSVESGRVCYLINGKRFCSKVQRSAKDYNGAPIYYFRRDSGEPTVVITGFS